MPKLRVHNFSISLDGYGAGLIQGPDKPFGDVDVAGPGVSHARLVRSSVADI